MRALLPTLLLLAVISGPAAAQDQDPPIDCDDARSTAEMNFCGDKALQAADEKLNEVYKKVLAHIAESGIEAPYDSESWEKAMREGQRAWVAFRDADCKGAVPMEWSGGSGAGAAVLGCMTQKTETRADELAERYGLNDDK
jgi:uncharacterized protein YecT (DUF1311 family)